MIFRAALLLLLIFVRDLQFSSALAGDYNTVISSGRLIDPDTGLDAIRNVAIEGDKIVASSEFPLQGDVVIDATGHVVSPGFIDMHSHGQNIGDYRMQVIQGVTTALELESGLGAVGDWYDGQARKNLPMNYGASAGWVHSRIATFSNTDPLATVDYFQDAQGRTDWKLDIASPEQSERIMSMVEQGRNVGALGIGVNAGYTPDYGHKEYFALAELAKKYNDYTHVRYASNTEPQRSFEAIQELISLAAITGAHMHLCHINSTSLSDIKATMALVEEAQAKGINVPTQVYPFGAASTVVGGAMFSGLDWRSKMGSTANNFQLGADRMTEDELADYQANKPGTMIVWHFLDEADPAARALLDVSVTNPATAIASDSVFWSYLDADGKILNYDGDARPLPDNVFSHPRSTVYYTKILRSFVRERGLLSLNKAIRKMSLLPAETLEKSMPQMRTKGRLQVVMDADIVIFDPATVADLATFQNANQPTVGVQTVIVNGGFSVRDGELVLDAPHGRAIRNNQLK